MKRRVYFLFLALILLFAINSFAQDEDLSDAELEAIAQRDMMEYMIMNAPIRFDKDLQVGEKLIYQSKYGEKEINTIEAVKDTLNAFWIREEFEGNTIYYLISRDNGELLDIKGYNEEGRFFHPHMLEDEDKDEVYSKRIDEITRLSDLRAFTLRNDTIQISIKS
ncbi:MAG: hypothetical protein K9N06_13550, partial [Candidatus Cloacimonetes bacterium]|nr:hypothetical protein [Candidatus Cloacimonadota bacterium]